MTSSGHCETLEELCDYITKYAALIFVRHEPTPEHPSWNWALSELPASVALAFMARCVKEGFTPVRMRSDEEMAQ